MYLTAYEYSKDGMQSTVALVQSQARLLSEELQKDMNKVMCLCEAWKKSVETRGSSPFRPGRQFLCSNAKRLGKMLLAIFLHGNSRGSGVIAGRRQD